MRLCKRFPNPNPNSSILCLGWIFLLLLMPILAMAQQAIPENLVLYLPCEDAQNPVDASPDPTTVAVEGVLVTADGQYGTQGLLFDGNAANRLQVINATNLSGMSALTINAWVLPTNIGAKEGLSVLSKRTAYNDADSYNLFTYQTNRTVNARVNGQGSSALMSTTNLEDDIWYHLAFVFDGTGSTGDKVKLYVNGVLEDSGDHPDSVANAGSAPVWIGELDANRGFAWEGVMDEIAIWNAALTEEDIAELMVASIAKILGGELASTPMPADRTDDVLIDADLAWESGEFALSHNVYFGISFEEVDEADLDTPDILVSQGQTATTYDPGRLAFDQTYYWRVDEVNGLPDKTVFKGDVWSFTVEPKGIPITAITATASGANATMEATKTVDGSGLNELDEHSALPTDMWLTLIDGSWIQYEFDKAYKLHELLVWNSNQAIEAFIGFGVKEAVIETSLDGDTWIPVDGVPEFSRASGTPTYQADTTVDLSGIVAKHVRISPQTAQGFTGQVGLSEVRFFYVPTAPREPDPAEGSTTANLDVTLSWRAGREAGLHEVHLGTDQQAVASGEALAATVSEPEYPAPSLQYGTTYYWQIVEVNNAEDPAAYVGDMWTIATPPYEALDDFEAYSGDEGEEVFMTWWDGYGGDASLGGSTTGYIDAPFVETSLVNGGGQSMPMIFDNDGGFIDIDGTAGSPRFSEVVREFDGVDFTAGNAEVLAVSFRGDAPGFTENADGTITMSAAGSNIWDNADQFRFAYKSLSGDGSISVKVNSIDHIHDWSKACVMIRASDAADAVHGMVDVAPIGAVQFIRRELQGGPSTSAQQTGLSVPYWVKITRTGNTLTAERSEDGVNWVSIAGDASVSSIDIIMPNDVLIGLGLTSRSSGNNAIAEFSEVSFTGNVTGAWTAQVIGTEAMASNEGQDPLYLIAEDSTGKTVTVTHSDSTAIQNGTWQDWLIPMTEFSSLRENTIKAITLGVGYKDGSQAGSEGTLYIDDLRIGTPIE